MRSNALLVGFLCVALSVVAPNLVAQNLVAQRLAAGEASWPQFRGPQSAGLAVTPGALPVEIGPDKNVRWKTGVPPGHSSPAIYGDRIYITGDGEDALFVTALERSSGTIRWQREVQPRSVEAIHSIGSHAQASATTDGERVVVFFGAYGLLCYDSRGKLLWERFMGPFKNHFGAASSPVIVDDWVIVNQDHDTDSFLTKLDKRTGEPVWTTDRSEFPRGFSTPAIWEVEGKKQIVVAGTLRVVGYDFDSGEEIWSVRGLARIVNVTPVVGSDGVLYVAAWSPGGGANPRERIKVVSFEEKLEEIDANKNGTLENNEVDKKTPLGRRFKQIDRDKNGEITKREYDGMAVIFHTAKNSAMAIRPGGKGDITDTHVLWTQRRMTPYVPPPLFHDGHLFMVKDGGIVSCLDARTGDPVKRERLAGRGNYYASPVAGDGKIYFLSERGELTVTSLEPEWKVLFTAEFGEDVYATPAIVEGKIYLRTQGYLYCFAQSSE